MDWLSLFIGILVGWIAEWFIDVFYWRQRCRSCEKNTEALQARLNEAEKRIKTYQVKGWQPETLPAHLGLFGFQVGPDVEVQAPAVGLPAGDPGMGLAAPEAALPGTGAAVELPPPVPEQPDDLKVIEGIGPKIAALLANNGILTFAQLAGTSCERLQDILRAGGPHFQLADPSTWPDQARLAADSAWDELKMMQERLSGGQVSRRG